MVIVVHAEKEAKSEPSHSRMSVGIFCLFVLCVNTFDSSYISLGFYTQGFLKMRHTGTKLSTLSPAEARAVNQITYMCYRLR